MTSPFTRCRLLGWAFAALLLVAPWTARADGELAEARRLYLSGKYAEAVERYEAATAADPVAAAVGKARALTSMGERDAARSTLEACAEKSPDAAQPQAELALLALERGDYDAAHKHVAAARAIDDNSILARYVEARLLCAAGQLEEAAAAYRWFFEFYNSHDVADADDLRWIGLAIAEHVRWGRRSGEFDTLVNDFYPAILKAEPDYWPAHYEIGQLFLEKYNEAEAARAFQEALKLNPSSAEVNAALARLSLARFDMADAQRATARALEINPELVEAHRCRADVLMANFEFEEAIQVLDKALELNPRAEETLGRLAACYLLLDGTSTEAADSRAAGVIRDLDARNPRAGVFYESLAAALAERLKFPAAEQYYRQAIERMPQLLYTRAGLGMMYMRMGHEAEARELLEASFADDPFNVRVKNTLEVLDVLDGYETLETEHFIIKFDPKKDRILARYIGRHLEEAFPKLCERLGYTPQEKSLFEIFNQARNSTGHQWFSARMVGLPYVGTVGACAGQMVALASPTSMRSPFNWARVVEHEFIHVVNLQQTNFNIPHWYTEALAVLNEGYPRPQEWNDLLRERVPKGDMFNLDTINLGFVRPKSGIDWQMAYCQAELYAEYMLATYGDDALAKMLAAYADNLDTPRALQRSFGIDQQEFERAYAEYVRQIVDALPPRPQSAELSLAELERAHESDPSNAETAAQLARAYLDREKYAEARRLARAALASNPHEPTAAYVVARLHLLVGDSDLAIVALEAALAEDAPPGDAVSLLASELLKAGRAEEAARWYAAAEKLDPDNPRWQKGLARVHLTTGDTAKLAASLERLAVLEADNASFRKKLAQMALAEKKYELAARWATETLHANVLDADAHRMLAESRLAVENHQGAIEEFETAIELAPDDPGLRMSLAEACAAAGDEAKARAVLAELLARNPDYPGATMLMESLKQ